jgi:hypothetical protein
MHRFSCLVLLAIFSTQLALAQQAQFMWGTLVTNTPQFQLFPPRNNTLLLASATDGQGNTIVAHRLQGEPGPTYPNSASNFLAKVDVDGSLLWSHRLLPHVFSVAADQSGNIYAVGGRTYIGLYGFEPQFRSLVPTNYFEQFTIPVEGSGSAYLARLNPEGELQSVRWLGESDRITATSIALHEDGSYFLAGRDPGNMGSFRPRRLPVGGDL